MHERGAVPQFRFRQFLFACQARILLKLQRPTEVRLPDPVDDFQIPNLFVLRFLVVLCWTALHGWTKIIGFAARNEATLEVSCRASETHVGFCCPLRRCGCDFKRQLQNRSACSRLPGVFLV